MAYAELAAVTNFSFLRGASHAEELLAQAARLGLTAIGIADHNTLAGVVRAHIAAKEHGVKILVGARLVLQEGHEIICYPETRAAYGRLSNTLSTGKLRAKKGECHLYADDVFNLGEEQTYIAIPPAPVTAHFTDVIGALAGQYPGRVFIGARYTFQGRNRERLVELSNLGADLNAPVVAITDALYHVAGRRPLQDILTCIREHHTIQTAGYALQANAERHLKSHTEIARLFKGFAPAIHRTTKIADRIHFSLDELAYEYPDEPVPEGATPHSHLEALTQSGADWRYPDGVPEKVQAALTKELGLIKDLNYAPYFLTVHDIVGWAREQEILCQGRGSAANSAVCYCLGITSIDPNNFKLLFERFLSKERKEPPDIDVDFEHERREEVIQYVYQRYGRDRAALTATVISYRSRSAIREVCKALGLSEDISSALAGTVWGSWGGGLRTEQIRQAGLDPDNPMIHRAIQLTQQLIGFPRHLSQHVGGFVLTRGKLTETVPIGNAAMADRTFIEWDKDDINALGIMKIDVLGLGMLTCIRKAFDFLKLHKGIDHTLASIPPNDSPTYDMLCKGDSLGVFQVESRAQMNMLPRLQPRSFYDLVIEVAIVRPGPIQGDMVHPYLRRRQGLETVTYPSPAPEYGPSNELERILGRTLGVPLFQEQAMQISIDAAKFTPEEANGLRRAMATFRKVGTIQNYEDMMVSRMIARGYDPAFSKRCFEQVKGFGEYGFPESHAASFALLVYVSAWLKRHHPDAFCAAILNSQPMGFYAPAQLVWDAREHDVDVREVDVNLSDWDNTLEPTNDRFHAVRIGLRQIDGVREEQMEDIVAQRGSGYDTPEDIRHRTGLNRSALETLAAADAFRSMGLDRRAALWATRGDTQGDRLPLFAAMNTHEQSSDGETLLPEMPPSEHVIQDYQTTRFSLKAHPLSFLRERYKSYGLVTTKEANALRNGSKVRTVGVVLVRQKPGSASGVCFITIEDETGVSNLVVWPRIGEVYRSVVMGARILLVNGRIQTADNVTHIVANQLIDRTDDLSFLMEDYQYTLDPLKNTLDHADHGKSPIHSRKGMQKRDIGAPLLKTLSPADEVVRPIPEDRQSSPKSISRRTARGRHPRNVRVIPKSRDFH